MKVAPSVSVVIPTYNNGQFVVRTLASVFAQDFQDFEVILVDDGSTDMTSDLVQNLDSRLRYIRQENQGVSAARNRGIEEAAGDLVAFLDSDDIWLPNNLSAKMAVLDAEVAVGAVFSEFEIFQGPRTICEYGSDALYPIFRRHGLTYTDIFGSKKHATARDGQPLYRSARIFDWLFRGNFVLTSTLVIRRKILDEIGRFDPELRTNEDYEFFLRLARASPMAYIEEPLVRYRRHLGQLTSPENNTMVLEAVLQVIDRQRSFFDDTRRVSVFNDRKSQVLTSLGKSCISGGHGPAAREYFRRSIRLRPARFENYVHSILSYLPINHLRRLSFLGRIWRIR